MSAFSKEKILKKQNKSTYEELEKLFEATQATIFHEAQILWQTSEVFLIANTILSVFIAQHIFDSTTNQLLIKPNNGLLVIAILGLVSCFIWLGSNRRISSYYRFRVAQARQREPKEWNLYDGDGKRFAEGNEVEIYKKSYSQGCWGTLFKNHNVPTFIIGLFALCYLLVIIITNPWI